MPESPFFAQIPRESNLLENLKETSQYKYLLNEFFIVSVTDTKGLITFANDSFYKESQYKQKELVGQDHKMLSSGFHSKEFMRELWTTIESGRVWKGEIKNKAKDGSYYWLDTTIVPFLNEQGQPYQYVSIRTDITRKKIATEQHELCASIIDSSEDAIISKNMNGIIRSWNKGAEKIFGYAASEIIGKSISILIPPHLLNEEKTVINKIKNGEILKHYETERVKKTGERVYVSLTASPIKDSFENTIGVSIISRDITSLKKNLEELRKSEAFTTAIFNTLSSNIAVIDYEGNIIAVNETWKKFALENGASSSLKTGLGNNYFSTCEKSAKAGSPLAAEALLGMREVINKNRNFFYIEYPCHSPKERKWFGMRVIKFEGDEPLMVVSHQNITERKLSEEKLLHNEARLNEAQTIAKIGSWENDFATDSGVWSNELFTIFGLEKDEKIASRELFLSFIHPDDLSFAISELDKAITDLKDSSFEFRFIKKDGETRNGFVMACFQFDENGRPVRQYGIVKDITEEKNAGAERDKMIKDIVQHNKDLQQFTYIVSHNLRHPIANIIGCAEILKDKDIDNVEKINVVSALLSSVRKLDEVVADLNYILQVRSDISEKHEYITFTQLTEDVRESIGIQAWISNVQFKTDFTAIDRVWTLKSYIYSIFYNLISNSIKYKRNDVLLIMEIKSKVDKDNVILTFKDNGLGIDLQKNQDYIFGLYKRFHNNVKGKGLGLFMVKTQVESLGGKIAVNSMPN